MNETLKAVVVELTADNVRNHHINLHGALGLFPDDCLGGRNEDVAAALIDVRFGSESVSTDIDQTKSIFRGRASIRRFFEAEDMREGDLVLIQRVEARSFVVSKASKRGFNYYL